jgi:hypothetical protein
MVRQINEEVQSKVEILKKEYDLKLADISGISKKSI